MLLRAPVRTAHEWGVIAEIVPTGKALSRARELAALLSTGAGGDTPQHMRAVHSSIEGAYRARSRLVRRQRPLGIREHLGHSRS